MRQNIHHGISVKFDDLPDDALISRPVVSAITCRQRTKLHCDVKRGIFPAPLKIGRNSRWRVGDIRAYLQRLGQQAAQGGAS